LFNYFAIIVREKSLAAARIKFCFFVPFWEATECDGHTDGRLDDTTVVMTREALHAVARKNHEKI